MSEFTEQLLKIKTLIKSSSKTEKSYAYSTLLHLQQQSTLNDSCIHSLADSSEFFLSWIVSDMRNNDADEEIVALALKCLGFMLYHPSIVAAIPKNCVDQVLKSLAALIVTTKTKVICNLGVWCISIQQLDASSLASHFDSLLRTIVYSLDNPAGSLSTTYEAVQAIMKLSTQLSENMRHTSSIWVPPIYRRLLSAEKTERDTCLRCLLKIKCLIAPPQLALSKAVAKDLKLTLLPGMKEMLKIGRKIHVLQAWGWFIRMLGYNSPKSRNLVNEMLKVPEQTFSDPDPQVQIATLVAWEGLIDALVCIPSIVCDGVTMHQHQVEQDMVKAADVSHVSAGIIQTEGYSKRLKLIMTPVIGILSSKADISVQSSCLNTWFYLLHKLQHLVNDPHTLSAVVDPIFQVVFNLGLNDGNIWIWSFCTNLLQDFIQSKISGVNYGSHDEVNFKLSPSISPSSGECTLKNYSICWLPWGWSQMDFLISIVQRVFCQAASATLSSDNKRLVCDVILRMFHIFLKGVKIELARNSTSCDMVMQAMKAILVFSKTVCETAFCEEKNGPCTDFQGTCLLSLQAVTKELDPSMLGSPLYKVSLDIQFVCPDEVNCKMLLGNSPIKSMDMVPPVVYLIVLYLSVAVQACSKASSNLFTSQEVYNYFQNVLSSYDSVEVLHAIVFALYAWIKDSSLRIWITVAQCLRDYMDGAKDLMPFKTHPASTGSLAVSCFLSYPLVCHSQKLLTTYSSLASPVLLDNFAQKEVIEVWIPLYVFKCNSLQQHTARKNTFAEDLCITLNGFLDQHSNLSENIADSCHSSEHLFLSLCGDFAKCILENLEVEKVTPEAIKCGYTKSSGINSCLKFVARLMNLIRPKMRMESMKILVTRLLPSLTQTVGHLQWKEDIISLIEVLCDPLLPWLSDGVAETNISVNSQLQLLWAEIIRCLQRSWPAIEFDSSFLKLQAPLLEKTLDHQNASFSEPTINFWNSTYGDQTHLDVPSCLLHVLDKLSRLGKIRIRMRRASTFEKDGLSLQVADSPHRHKVTATLSACSKRVKLMENRIISSPRKSELPLYPKGQRSELTEHQKEVKRAQQGKGRDCSGHGPGIRTYTGLDFSQGNEDSQDSGDIRDPEQILDLLKRTC